MSYRSLFQLLFFLLPSLQLWGQDDRYIYHELEGVVSNEIIKGIIKDTTGYIWLATDQGVLNYDGTWSELYDRGLQSTFTKNFLSTADGRLLVINDLGLKEVVKTADSAYFKPFELGNKVYGEQLNYPKSIYQDQSGTIWIGEVNSVVRINRSGMKRYNLGTEYQSISYHRTFLFDEDAFGNLWMAPFKGDLLRYNKAKDELEEVTSLPLTDVTGFSIIKGDHLLIGGKEGLYQLKIDSYSQILATAFYDEPQNVSALIGIENEVFVGTWDQGLFRFDFSSKAIEKIARVNFNDVVDFYFDRQTGELWVIGSENVGLFSQSPISMLANVGRYRIESLGLSGDDLYYSIGQEVRKTELGSSGPVTQVLVSKNKYFDCITADESDLWIGDSFGAIYKYDLASGKLITLKDSTGRAIKSVFPDRQGNKWFAGDQGGLIRIDGSDSLHFYENITSSNVVKQGPDGSIYCGIYGKENFIYKLSSGEDSFHPVPYKPDFHPEANISIEDIAIEPSGNVWLASSEGLLYLENGLLSRITVPEMDPGESYKAVVYKQGITWAASNHGLIAFDGRDAILFTNENGLPSKILKERGILIRDEELLIATAKGLAKVDISQVQFKKTPSPIFKEIAEYSSFERNEAGVMVLPYHGRLQAEFVALSYPGKDILYQSRVTGLEDSWSKATTSRQVSFLGFSEGSYELQVRAQEKGCLWSEPTTLRFNVAAPWFKTWWAYFLFSVTTIGVFALGARVYHYSLIRQKRRLQRIIEERTEQVNRQKNEIIEQKNHIIKQKEELIAKNNAVYKSQQALSEADLNFLHLKERQLQDQIEFRNKQITTHTLNIIQKNETLKELRDKLEGIIKSPQRVPQTELRKTLKIIDESFKLDRDWDEFKLYFEQVYTGFYTKLKINCPSLTNQELRHCALIRLNLSIPECASILGISPDSVKVSRARIRKKLDLDHGQGLTDFILSV